MIIPNASVRVTRNGNVAYPSLRVQLNFYTGDSASGGRTGEHQGTLSARRNVTLMAGDIITVLSMWPYRNPPLITEYSLGNVVQLGQPGAHIIAPLFGGRRQA